MLVYCGWPLDLLTKGESMSEEFLESYESKYGYNFALDDVLKSIDELFRMKTAKLKLKSKIERLRK